MYQEQRVNPIAFHARLGVIAVALGVLFALIALKELIVIQQHRFLAHLAQEEAIPHPLGTLHALCAKLDTMLQMQLFA